jgi:hypothetical protein
MILLNDLDGRSVRDLCVLHDLNAGGCGSQRSHATVSSAALTASRRPRGRRAPAARVR